MTDHLPNQLASARLGETAHEWEIDSRPENREATLAMVANCRRSISIFSRELDAALYDDSEVIAALRQTVVNTRRIQIRILAQNLTRAITDGHRFLDLGKRLSSFIEIRVCAREHHNFNTALLIADATGYIARRHADRYEGTVNFHDPSTARDYTKLFDEMWSASQSDPAVRALHI